MPLQVRKTGITRPRSSSNIAEVVARHYDRTRGTLRVIPCLVGVAVLAMTASPDEPRERIDVREWTWK
jgi:hypothetical protein